MKIIDISWPISCDMTTYKNQNPVSVEYKKKFEQDGVRQSSLILNSHTGTHVDAPSHFLKDGISIDQISFSSLIGPCFVADCTDSVDKITREDLEKYEQFLQKDLIILLKTKNSLRSPFDCFDFNFIFLEKGAAEYLTEKKIKAVGIDYLGIERDQPNHETHSILMTNSIVIIEGLRLQNVKQGMYQIICLPLLVTGLEAAPARAILIKE